MLVPREYKFEEGRLRVYIGDNLVEEYSVDSGDIAKEMFKDLGISGKGKLLGEFAKEFKSEIGKMQRSGKEKRVFKEDEVLRYVRLKDTYNPSRK